MSPTFLGLVVLAEVARSLNARNALLSLIRKQHGTRMPAIHERHSSERHP